MASLTTHHLYPPFPADLPTASLVSVSLKALESQSSEESSRLLSACQELGFFYLDLTDSELGRNILVDVEKCHLLQQDFYALPHEVKDDYGRDKVDPFFSYRWTGCADGVKDVWDRPGRREMYNLRVDDILGIRPHLARHTMISNAEPLLSSFALNCRKVVRLLLQILEQQLRLPRDSLLSLHRDDTARGDFVSLQHRASEPSDDTMIQKGEHTDFGSITMLFNWLGGLQIRAQSPGDRKVGDWVYVQPIPGSCVINLADSLVKLTAGMLKSNIHRVAPAPGKQAGLPRYSLVYFSHPNDDVVLKPIEGADQAAAFGTEDEEPITAADWVIRRSLGDLRGIYTYKGGLELRDNDDAVVVPGHVRAAA